MKTFKQFQEEINKPSISLAAKAMGKLGSGLGLALQTVKGIVQGKHKKRSVYLKKRFGRFFRKVLSISVRNDEKKGCAGWPSECREIFFV